MKFKHEGFRIKCDKCGYSCSDKRKLKLHDVTKHIHMKENPEITATDPEKVVIGASGLPSKGKCHGLPQDLHTFEIDTQHIGIITFDFKKYNQIDIIQEAETNFVTIRKIQKTFNANNKI